MQDSQMILYHWYSSFWKWTTGINHWPKVGKFSLMSRIDCKYCSICTSYLAGLFDIFILLHIWQNHVCFGDFLPMRTLCDAYPLRNLNLISVQSWTYLQGLTLKAYATGAIKIFLTLSTLWNIQEECQLSQRTVLVVCYWETLHWRKRKSKNT